MMKYHCVAAFPGQKATELRCGENGRNLQSACTEEQKKQFSDRIFGKWIEFLHMGAHCKKDEQPEAVIAAHCGKGIGAKNIRENGEGEEHTT